MDKFVNKLIIEETIRSSQIERLDSYFKKDPENYKKLIEEIIKKYSSESYKNKEYKLGYEPRESLYDLLFDYSQKYCRPASKAEIHKYGNYFTTGSYVINEEYFIHLMIGQGSVIQIEKMSGFVSGCCIGTKCPCGKNASHKIEEVVFDDDPLPDRHPLTNYICHDCFSKIMKR